MWPICPFPNQGLLWWQPWQESLMSSRRKVCSGAWSHNVALPLHQHALTVSRVEGAHQYAHVSIFWEKSPWTSFTS